MKFLESHPVTPPRGEPEGASIPRGAGGGIFLAAAPRNLWCAGHAVNLKGESPEGAVMTGIL